ncbi:ethanolamine kinase 1 isoform X2 [Sipha flava]|uniref:ethanolamine kinase n=1 Tax=Sipha flava TaxID=143950 RepID=A0A8B8FEW0_9HEMI|nr:ethanolamine kinase 1 isoform X2 [Sipha flava]
MRSRADKFEISRSLARRPANDQPLYEVYKNIMNKNSSSVSTLENSANITFQSKNMSSIPHVPIFIEDDSIKSGSQIILKCIRPDWNIDNIRYKLFTDGITNKLIGLFNDSCLEDNAILIRVYGRNTEQIIDRDAELKNLKLLHHAGLAPNVYATFENGIAYKYIQGETLTMTMVREPSIYKLVAKTMARFHQLDVSTISDKTNESELWSKMEQFAGLIPKRFSSDSTDQQFRKIFTSGVEGLRSDIENIKMVLENIGSPIVFSHNDLLLNNIILQRDTGGNPVNVAFIDYEYAMLNYQAFDIANHFIEFAGVYEPDFSSHYPNIELQMDWLTFYLEEFLNESLDQSDQRVAVLKDQVDKYAQLRFEQYEKMKKLLNI